MAKVKEVDPQKITFLDEGEEVLYTATNNVGWIAEASTQYGIDFIPGWFKSPEAKGKLWAGTLKNFSFVATDRALYFADLIEEGDLFRYGYDEIEKVKDARGWFCRTIYFWVGGKKKQLDMVVEEQKKVLKIIREKTNL